jgi:glycosyltransferase involved in cell wall biosynthesis
MNGLRLDVIIPTWNSESTLEKVLAALEEFLVPNKIIIVDRKSQDKTREIAERHRCVILTDEVSLGSARMLGIRSSDAEIIAFIDDDIVLRDDFRYRLKDYFSSDVGAVQGIALPMDERMRVESINLLRKRFQNKEYVEIRPNERGYTNLTFIRRELLQGLDISDMNAYEDFVISRYILSKRFKWIIVPIYADHIHEQLGNVYSNVIIKSAWNYSGIWNLHRTGRMSLLDTVRFFFLRVISHPISLVENPGRNNASIQFHHMRSFIGAIISPVLLIKPLDRTVMSDKKKSKQ